jgi:hypothetical protein
MGVLIASAQHLFVGRHQRSFVSLLVGDFGRTGFMVTFWREGFSVL